MRSVKFLLIVTIPAAGIVSLWSKEIIQLLYGSAFTGAAATLRILICPIVLFPIANLFGNALIASHHQKADLAINGVSALLNVVLNAFLIRRYGYYGAALATLISIVLYVFLQSIAVRKFLFPIRYGTLLTRPLAAAAVMIAAMFGLRMLTPLVSSAVGLALFVLTLAATRYISEDELGIFRDLWKEKRLLFTLGRGRSDE